MNVFRIWCLRLRALWTRIAMGFFGVLAMIMFAPTGWTPSEQIAAKSGYWEGLVARLSDPILWERALASGFAVALFMAVFLPSIYFFSLWAHSFEKKR